MHLHDPYKFTGLYECQVKNFKVLGVGSVLYGL